jgi:hypothetical protein
MHATTLSLTLTHVDTLRPTLTKIKSKIKTTIKSNIKTTIVDAIAIEAIHKRSSACPRQPLPCRCKQDDQDAQREQGKHRLQLRQPFSPSHSDTRWRLCSSRRLSRRSSRRLSQGQPPSPHSLHSSWRLGAPALASCPRCGCLPQPCQPVQPLADPRAQSSSRAAQATSARTPASSCSWTPRASTESSSWTTSTTPARSRCGASRN